TTYDDWIFVVDTDYGKLISLKNFGSSSQSLIGSEVNGLKNPSGVAHVTDSSTKKTITFITGTDGILVSSDTQITIDEASPYGIIASPSDEKNGEKVLYFVGKDAIKRLFKKSASTWEWEKVDVDSAINYSSLRGIAQDNYGNIYVTDPTKRLIQKLSPPTDATGDSWHVETITAFDSEGKSAQFTQPWGIALDSKGDLLITDNDKIQKLHFTGNLNSRVTDTVEETPAYLAVSTILENAAGNAAAQFANPSGIISMNGALYVADTNNRRIQQLTKNRDDTWKVSSYSGGFGNPGGLTSIGNKLYVADSLNLLIYELDLGSDKPSPTIIAGTGKQGVDDADIGTKAQFTQPWGITRIGNDLYVTDSAISSIRQLTKNSDGKTWKVSTIAGMRHEVSNTHAVFKDDVYGRKAVFNWPYDITNMNGALYVSDTNNHLIRELVKNSDDKTWKVSTIAGQGRAGFKDGTREEAQFNRPYGITSMGKALYVVDRGNFSIRKLVKKEGKWQVSTIAGDGNNGYINGTGMASRFSQPWGITSIGTDALYVVDTQTSTTLNAAKTGYTATNYIRKIDFSSDNTPSEKLASEITSFHSVEELAPQTIHLSTLVTDATPVPPPAPVPLTTKVINTITSSISTVVNAITPTAVKNLVSKLFPAPTPPKP
ncbi:MAG: hypothetical protein WCN27_01190, partial [Alphaproteobacteria bacterium]